MTGVESYIKKMSKNNLLTKQQEIDLAKKIEKGDKNAKNIMIQSNLRLAFSIAKKYSRHGFDLEDLIQEANIGLIKAVERYDWRKGFKFSTYACWWIKQATTNHITHNSTSIKIPTHLLGYARKVYQAKIDYVETFNQEPEPEEIADILGLSIKDVKEAFNVISAKKTVSIDKSVSDENSRSILEMIPDPAKTPDLIIHDKEIKEEIIKAFSKLSKREEIIIRLRFGITDVPENKNYELTQGEK